MQRTEDQGRWYDPGQLPNDFLNICRIITGPDAGEVIDTVDPKTDGVFNPQADCKRPDLKTDPEFGENTAFAYTLKGGNFYTITLCPWFFDLVGQPGFKASYSFSSWARAKVMKIMNYERRVAQKHFTPVDLMSLFDKVLLHEVSELIFYPAIAFFYQ